MSTFAVVDVQSLFRRQGGPHPRQHSFGAAVNGAACVYWQTTFRRVAVIISAGLYRGGASSADNHAIEVVATGRSALFTAEVMR